MTVPSTPDLPPIPPAYNWLKWPLAPTVNAIDEAQPDLTKGGWGSETAGMMASYNDTGKSYGLFGPSNKLVNGTVTTLASEYGILGTRLEMTTGGCLPKYMAVTILPASNSVFTQTPTATDPWAISLTIGAYAWGTYDFTAPIQPTLAAAVDASAMTLVLQSIGLISALSLTIL